MGTYYVVVLAGLNFFLKKEKDKKSDAGMLWDLVDNGKFR